MSDIVQEARRFVDLTITVTDYETMGWILRLADEVERLREEKHSLKLWAAATDHAIDQRDRARLTIHDAIVHIESEREQDECDWAETLTAILRGGLEDAPQPGG